LLEQPEPITDKLGMADLPVLAFLLLIVPALLFGWCVRRRHGRTVCYYLQVPSRCGLTGIAFARRLLDRAGIGGTRIAPARRFWATNHYNPLTREIRLSTAVYASTSVSALGIAAHEVGHAIQHAQGYAFSWLRTILFPVTSVCSLLGIVALGFGIIEGSTSMTWAGVALFGSCLVLPLITLPVEFDASSRARAMIAEAGIVEPEELSAIDQVLHMAALTYVARVLQAASCLFVLVLVLWVGHDASTRFLTEGEYSLWVVAGMQCLGVVWLAWYRKRAPAQSALDARVLNNTANALAEQGELAEAISTYSEAISIDPRLAQAYANRGETYARTGQLDEALVDLDKAIELDLGLGAVRASRGRVHFLRHEYDAALADYEEALRLAPDIAPFLRICQGDIWLARGETGQAIRMYGEALEHQKSRAAALCSRGLAWFLRDDFDRALTDLDEAIGLAPGEAVAYNNRGAVFLKQGDYARALTDLQTAIGLNPKHPNAFKNLAWLQATCPDASFRDGGQAVANATRAMELAGSPGRAWLDILAAAHAEAGQFDEAVRCQEEHLAASPAAARDDHEARLKLYRDGQPFRAEQPTLRFPSTKDWTMEDSDPDGDSWTEAEPLIFPLIHPTSAPGNNHFVP